MKTYLIAATVALLATTAQAQPGSGGRRPNPDANDDGKVTLEEFRAADGVRQARILARLDANKDGKVSPEEAKAVGERKGASRGGGGDIMKLDANKDGFITLEELSTTSQRRFDMADANKDGSLSGEELNMMRQRMRGPAS
jgi:hypothetical protein